MAERKIFKSLSRKLVIIILNLSMSELVLTRYPSVDNSLPPLRLHDLRHTFASIANELGIGIYDTSKALGHSQIGTTTQIYTHLFKNSD